MDPRQVWGHWALLNDALSYRVEEEDILVPNEVFFAAFEGWGECNLERALDVHSVSELESILSGDLLDWVALDPSLEHSAHASHVSQDGLWCVETIEGAPRAWGMRQKVRTPDVAGYWCNWDDVGQVQVSVCAPRKAPVFNSLATIYAPLPIMNAAVSADTFLWRQVEAWDGPGSLLELRNEDVRYQVLSSTNSMGFPSVVVQLDSEGEPQVVIVLRHVVDAMGGAYPSEVLKAWRVQEGVVLSRFRLSGVTRGVRREELRVQIPTDAHLYDYRGPVREYCGLFGSSAWPKDFTALVDAAPRLHENGLRGSMSGDINRSGAAPRWALGFGFACIVIVLARYHHATRKRSQALGGNQ